MCCREVRALCRSYVTICCFAVSLVIAPNERGKKTLTTTKTSEENPTDFFSHEVHDSSRYCCTRTRVGAAAFLRVCALCSTPVVRMVSAEAPPLFSYVGRPLARRVLRANLASDCDSARGQASPPSLSRGDLSPAVSSLGRVGMGRRTAVLLLYDDERASQPLLLLLLLKNRVIHVIYGGPQLIGPMVYIKTYIFYHFY